MSKIKTLAGKIRMKMHGGVVGLPARGRHRGDVLISYTTLPFISPELIGGHTNRWECYRMAEAWRERGYAVDVIDFENTRFVPKKRYDYFFDIHHNMERLAPLLGSHCVKVLHLTTSHWLFNNTAEYARLSDLAKRRGTVLPPERLLAPNRSVECADVLLFFGNEFTKNNYLYAKKEMHCIPISTTYEYEFTQEKNFSETKKKFVWIGGAGPVHKGVDLLLEVFSKTPEQDLFLCGKVNDPAFESVYRHELSDLTNIHTLGMTDLGGREFEQVRNSAAFVISPSCAEGQSGSVIVGMHAGLIPIVSKESGIDTHDFGVTLKENSVAEIMRAAQEVSSLPPETLASMSRKAWEYAREHHTRKTFGEAYDVFIDNLLQKHG